jgi:tetratricopeptide (TPR) repeat protein
MRKSIKQERLSSQLSASEHYPWVIVCLFVFALAVRFFYLWEISESPAYPLLLGDAESYDQWAQEISAGNWTGNQIFYQAPLYPYFLGVIYFLFGHNLLIVRICQVLLGSLSCVLISVAGSHFYDKKTGIFAGLLLAIYPTAIFFDCQIQKSTLDLVLFSGLLLLFGKVIRHPHGIIWMLIGIAMGCLGLNRENALILVPATYLWMPLFFRRERKKNLLIWMGSFLLGLVIVLGPVAFRNKIVGGEFVLTTSQFGSNLYIGNNEQSEGTYTALRQERGDWVYERQDAIELAEKALGKKLTPSEVSSFWVKKTLSHIKSNLVSWSQLMMKKWALFWNAVELSDTESQYVYYNWSVLLKTAGTFFHFGILCPLAVVGIWVTRKQWNRLWLLYLMLISYAASVTLFYVFARYRLPVVTILVIFAAAFLRYGVNAFKTEPLKNTVICGILLIFASITVNWKLADQGPMIANTYYNMGCNFEKEKNYQQAIDYYSKSVHVNPTHAMALNNLGRSLLQQNRIEEAMNCFLKALSINPDLTHSHNNLGILLAQQGQFAEALKHFLTVIALEPDYNNSIYYNIACVYAQMHHIEKSISSLDEALKRGYNNWCAIINDKDLEQIRDTSYYKELVNRITCKR